MAPTVSVFTPSNDSRWLNECLESLNAQSFEDWEWIILLNHGAEWEQPKKRTGSQPLRVYTASSTEVTGVGSAKRAACAFAHGEILVELDHDDLLEPNALQVIVDAFDADPELGFFYSDWCQITPSGKREESRWDNGGDWQYYEAQDGLLAARSFEPYPHNVSTMVFAPNHVRAFRHSVYKQVGGYDKNRMIADDLDLIARMYQAAPFYHHGAALYRQRIHPHMTQVQKETNEAIQIASLMLYDTNIEANALAWAERELLMRIDLGGAHNSPESEYVTIDKAKGADLVGDVFDVLADFEDSCVGVIRAVDFIEHIADPIALMNECWRVMAHGAVMLTITPSTDGRGAWQDPTHVRGWNENSFWYYTDEQYAKYVPEIQCRFQVSRLVTYFPSDWHRDNQIPYVAANLIAIKADEPRMGGRLAI